MCSAEVELPARLRDDAPDDASLAPIERMVGSHARVAPVASGRIPALGRFDRHEAGAAAALVSGELPVEKLDQIVLAQRFLLRLVLHEPSFYSVERLELDDRGAVVGADPEG